MNVTIEQRKHLKRMKRRAEIAEAVVAEKAREDAPWATRNVYTYQNIASKWWGDYYAVCRAAGVIPDCLAHQ